MHAGIDAHACGAAYRNAGCDRCNVFFRRRRNVYIAVNVCDDAGVDIGRRMLDQRKHIGAHADPGRTAYANRARDRNDCGVVGSDDRKIGLTRILRIDGCTAPNGCASGFVQHIDRRGNRYANGTCSPARRGEGYDLFRRFCAHLDAAAAPGIHQAAIADSRLDAVAMYQDGTGNPDAGAGAHTNGAGNHEGIQITVRGDRHVAARVQRTACASKRVFGVSLGFRQQHLHRYRCRNRDTTAANTERGRYRSNVVRRFSVDRQVSGGRRDIGTSPHPCRRAAVYYPHIETDAHARTPAANRESACCAEYLELVGRFDVNVLAGDDRCVVIDERMGVHENHFHAGRPPHRRTAATGRNARGKARYGDCLIDNGNCEIHRDEAGICGHIDGTARRSLGVMIYAGIRIEAVYDVHCNRHTDPGIAAGADSCAACDILNIVMAFGRDIDVARVGGQLRVMAD